jgi:hypothetical protein
MVDVRYSMSCGTMQFDECWYTIDPQTGKVAFLGPDHQDDAIDAYDFEAEIVCDHEGYWDIAEVRLLLHGHRRRDYQAFSSGDFYMAAAEYIGRRWQEDIDDRVQCEAGPFEQYSAAYDMLRAQDVVNCGRPA